MKILNLRKETSERSDSLNWAKKILIKESPFFFESIEGCNQNVENRVTHLFERARIDETEGRTSKNYLINEIVKLEGKESLERKINFAKLFNIPLSYVLYCDESEHVYLFNFITSDNFNFTEKYNTYKEFADWIAKIKGWKSTKLFREIKDLPHFDKELRKHKTSWPTNIDCFFTDKENKPIGIIEFQNAKDTGVFNHCNNDYFQCKISYSKKGKYGSDISFSDDIRRWISQEILRVQSNLSFFILTWSQSSNDFVLKELDSVAIPYFYENAGKVVWTELLAYKYCLHQYVISGRSKKKKEKISSVYRTYSLKKNGDILFSKINNPVLNIEDKTFPALYYKTKIKIKNNRKILPKTFMDLCRH